MTKPLNRDEGRDEPDIANRLGDATLVNLAIHPAIHLLELFVGNISTLIKMLG